VLIFVLGEHPDQLTVAELASVFCRDPKSFSERDTLERAIRELVGAGLLRIQGDLVMPTRAALYFERLEL